jgi:hypothetical protein
MWQVHPDGPLLYRDSPDVFTGTYSSPSLDLPDPDGKRQFPALAQRSPANASGFVAFYKLDMGAVTATGAYSFASTGDSTSRGSGPVRIGSCDAVGKITLAISGEFGG